MFISLLGKTRRKSRPIALQRHWKRCSGFGREVKKGCLGVCKSGNTTIPPPRPMLLQCALLRFVSDIFTCHKGGEIFKLLRSRQNNKPGISFLIRHQKRLDFLYSCCFWMSRKRNPLNGLLFLILVQ